MGVITVKDSDPAPSGTVSFLDAKGNPTSPDDTPQWSSDNPTVADVSPSDDGMSCSFPLGAPGAAVISVTSTDADGTQIVSQGTITVQPGEAAVGDVEFTAGAPAAPPAGP